MPNLNIDVSPETLFKWRAIKNKLKAENNQDCLKKILDLVEKTVGVD